jgi:DNA-binding Lrp family transcriptional regulator
MNTLFWPDAADCVILESLQDDLPLVSHPWKSIADRIGIPESEMLSRMKRMEDLGIIRGISPVLESRPLGLHAATLVALRVPEERLEEVAAVVSSYPEVSHNFQRDHAWSLWFTLAARDRESLRRIFDDILEKTGIAADDAIDLPTIHRIKIDVRFSFIPGTYREHSHGQD